MPEKRKRLKQVRESAGFTQEDLAYRLGVRAKLVELIAETHPQPGPSLAAQTLEKAARRRKPGLEVVDELADEVAKLADR